MATLGCAGAGVRGAHGHSQRVARISRGTVQANRRKVSEYGLWQVLLQQERAVAQASGSRSLRAHPPRWRRRPSAGKSSRRGPAIDGGG